VLKDKEGDREWRRIEVDFRTKTARRFFLSRQGSFWWGDGSEKIPWHQIEIPDEQPNPFATCGLSMEIPYRYSVRGSVCSSGENMEGNPFRTSADEEVLPQWQGSTAFLTLRTGEVEELFELTLGEQNTKITSFKYTQRSNAKGVTCRFEIVDIPLCYAGKLGDTGIAISIFGLKLEEVRKHVKSVDSKLTQVVIEIDPATRKEVQSTVTSEITSIGERPEGGGACFVSAFFCNYTMAQLQEMIAKGQTTEAELSEALEKASLEIQRLRE
jgi:hypothetical protein